MPSASPRSISVDHCRGLAILGMSWSGMVPYETLPAWMYHAQLPPPSREFNPNVYGITWVDLVFPLFLFCLGVAIPFALGGRLEKGDSPRSVAWDVVSRGFGLAIFALLGQHLRPYVMEGSPKAGTWGLALLGFVALLLVFVRLPATWSRRAVIGARGAGYALAAGIILTHAYPDDTTGFANYRNDVILMVLANVAVSGGLIWLFTRSRPWVRALCAAAVTLIILGATRPGLAKFIWDWEPWHLLSKGHFPGWFDLGEFMKSMGWPDRWKPILYHFEYHKYLLIVLPATFVGEWLRAPREAIVTPRRKAWALAAVTGAMLLVAFWGFTVRHHENPTFPAFTDLWKALEAGEWVSRPVVVASLALVGLYGLAFRIAERPELRRMLALGFGLLVIGLLAEPLGGGGLRKDPPTLSYFWMTSALSIALIATFESLFEAKSEAWNGGWLAACGQNPILAYIAITNVIPAVTGLTQLNDKLADLSMDPWFQTGWGLVKSLMVVAFAAWLTRKRVVMRA
ncbi:MAG: DUF5009 domain-containing protein [Armatimonadetes bacterium]|nr:DUF5009 domain-containing protein [Armatimonadota bacterium]